MESSFCILLLYYSPVFFFLLSFQELSFWNALSSVKKSCVAWGTVWNWFGWFAASCRWLKIVELFCPQTTPSALIGYICCVFRSGIVFSEPLVGIFILLKGGSMLGSCLVKQRMLRHRQRGVSEARKTLPSQLWWIWFVCKFFCVQTYTSDSTVFEAKLFWWLRLELPHP